MGYDGIDPAAMLADPDDEDRQQLFRRIEQALSHTMIGAIGFHLISVGDGTARAYMDYKPSLTMATGYYHAAALVALADNTAFAAALHVLDPTDSFDLRTVPLPLTADLALTLIDNRKSGRVIAAAKVVVGGTTDHSIAVATKLTDPEGLIIAHVYTRHVPTRR